MERKVEIEPEGFWGDMEWAEVVAVGKDISEAEEEVYAHVPVLDKKHFLSKKRFVEKTFTTDCFLNAFSCAQIGKSRFNANAKYYINPFSLSSSSMPSFTLFPSSIASSIANLLFADNDSNMNLCNSFDFSNFSGILITNSAISIAYNHKYL